MSDATENLELELAAAVDAERVNRSAAFHPVHEHILNFAVVPLTLEKYSLLRLAASPFIPPYGEPSEATLTQFLWVVSPEFQPHECAAKEQLIARCKKLFVKPAPPRQWLPFYELRYRRWRHRAFNASILFGEACEAVKKYVDEARQDAPPSVESVISPPDYYSDEAMIIAQLARNYGWSQKTIWKLKLKLAYQYLKEIREHEAAQFGQRALLWNRSDDIIDRALEQANRNRLN